MRYVAAEGRRRQFTIAVASAVTLQGDATGTKWVEFSRAVKRGSMAERARACRDAWDDEQKQKNGEEERGFGKRREKRQVFSRNLDIWKRLFEQNSGNILFWKNPIQLIFSSRRPKSRFRKRNYELNLKCFDYWNSLVKREKVLAVWLVWKHFSKFPKMSLWPVLQRETSRGDGV